MSNTKQTVFIPDAWKPYTTGWLESLKAAGFTSATMKSRRHKITRIANLLGKSPLDVSTRDIISIFAHQDWKPETRKAYRNTVHSFFAWMTAQDFINEDISQELPKIRKSRPTPHPCPDKYILVALRKANDSEKIMLRLAAECGLRRAEIAQVNSMDLIDDLLGKSLIVHGKGNKERIVPLSDDLAKIIEEAHGYVFPGRWTGHVEESYIGKHISRLLPQGFGAHSLRHRFATTTWEHTHDLLLVSRLLGHESVETTQIYVAMPSSHLRTAIESVRLTA